MIDQSSTKLKYDRCSRAQILSYHKFWWTNPEILVFTTW